MTSKTLLLDLPNELFPYILQYLSSIDIFKSFVDIQCARIQALISPFLTAIDLSKESDEWIEKSLPKLSHRKEIHAIRIEINHLSLISNNLFSNDIQSMDVLNSNYDFKYSDELMNLFYQNLKKLTLTSCTMSDVDYNDVQFLRSDSQLTHLTINSSTLLYFNTPLEICTRLIYLSVNLEGMEFVFTLLRHLPNLQELKVAIISQECYPQSPPDSNGVQPCKTLRTVTFKGWIKYFDHMETFFETFGSSIEYLSMEILLMYMTLDGTYLEHNLLDKMPCLSSLNLNISSIHVDNDDPIQIETFQSFAWDQINPIVYWYDLLAQQHMLFTLPYRLDRVERLSNECVSTCISNRAVSLSFQHVRTLSLINTTPLNLETFLFIEKCFPKVTKIELVEKMIHPLAENDDDDEYTSILSLNEDLLTDTKLQISSVTKFCINVYRRTIDYKTIYRFLCLFSKLVDLELKFGCPVLHDLLQHKDEDDRVATALARITHLNIVQLCKTDRLTATDMHCLFPNVKHIKTSETDDLG